MVIMAATNIIIVTSLTTAITINRRIITIHRPYIRHRRRIPIIARGDVRHTTITTITTIIIITTTIITTTTTIITTIITTTTVSGRWWFFSSSLFF